MVIKYQVDAETDSIMTINNTLSQNVGIFTTKTTYNSKQNTLFPHKNPTSLPNKEFHVFVIVHSCNTRRKRHFQATMIKTQLEFFKFFQL